MPRSVNSVAAKARRKKILKAAKGYFGRRKNVHTVAKNAVEKGMLYAYRDRKNKKEHLELYGFKELMQVQDFTECHIQSSWVKFTQMELN